MKSGFIIFGVIFIILGLFLYLVPTQKISVDTTTTDGSNTDTRASSASVTIHVGWSYALATIGVILLVFGIVIPSSKSNSKKDSYAKVVESKENIEVGDGNKRKVVRERTEKYNSRKDDD